MNRFLSLLATVAVTTNFAHSFGGPLVGIELGAGYLNADHSTTNAAGATGKKSASKLGLFYGGFADYLYEIGSSKTFVGGGLHFNSSNAKETADYGVDGGAVLGQVKIDRQYGFAPRAIIGKLMNPKVMLYTSIAYEFAKYELKYTGTINQKTSKTFKAIVPSAGIMYRAKENIIVTASYSHTFFKKEDIISNGTVTQLDPAEHRLVVGVAYKFNIG